MNGLSRVFLATACSFAAIAASETWSYGAERAALQKSYATLKANSLKAIEDGKVETLQTQVKGTKLTLVGGGQIPPAPPMGPMGPPLRLGVKVWAQLINPAGQPGPYVNLEKYPWHRMERFYLWLETAVPLQLALFQNYPEGRPPSRQISPNLAFPQTFATIMPGVPYRFPVMLAMDDDLRDELLSIVVVRADAQVLPINGAPPITAPAEAAAAASMVIDTNPIPPGSQITINGTARSRTRPLSSMPGPGGVLKDVDITGTKEVTAELHKQARSKPIMKSGRMKLGLVLPPPPAMPVSSPRFEDVAILLMGPGNVAQIELTLHKD